MNNGRMFSKLATSRSLSQIIILMKMEMRMWTKKMVLANKMHFLVFPVLVFVFSWELFGIEFDDNVDEGEDFKEFEQILVNFWSVGIEFESQ